MESPSDGGIGSEPTWSQLERCTSSGSQDGEEV
jgi:hypothetical protein